MSVFHVGWNTLGSEHIGRLRVLDATAEGLEADLAAARGRARGAASVRLQAAFPDFDFVAIARRSGTADPRTVECDPEFVSWLDPDDALDAVLLANNVGDPIAANSPAIKLARDGDYLPLRPIVMSQKHQALDPSLLAGIVRSDVGLVINSVDSRVPKWSRLVDDLRTVTDSDVRINAYVADGTASGFGPHWDDHDVIVVQTTGAKLWSFHQPSGPAPHRAVTPSEVGPLVGDLYRLKVGEGVFVPHGIGHNVICADSLAVHLTIGFLRPSPLDVLEAMAQPAHQLPAMRVPFVFHPDGPLDSDTPSLGDPDAFGAAVGELGGTLFESAVQAIRLGASRPPFAGPIALLRATADPMEQEPWVACSFGLGLGWVDGAADDRFLIAAHGGVFDLPEALGQLVTSLADGRYLAWRDFVAALPRAERSRAPEVLDELVAIGLIADARVGDAPPETRYW